MYVRYHFNPEYGTPYSVLTTCRTVSLSSTSSRGFDVDGEFELCAGLTICLRDVAGVGYFPHHGCINLESD